MKSNMNSSHHVTNCKLALELEKECKQNEYSSTSAAERSFLTDNVKFPCRLSIMTVKPLLDVSALNISTNSKTIKLIYIC